MKRLGAVVGVGVILGTGAQAAPRRPRLPLDPARAILIRSLTPVDTSYTGEQVTVVQGAGAARKRPPKPLHQLVYRSGGVLRVNYSTGQVMYDDGRTLQLYLPRQRIVETESSRLGRTVNQQRLLRGPRVSVSRLADDTVAGRPAYVLDVTDTLGKLPVRRVWVDRETYVQLRQDVTGQRGRTVSTYFTSIDFSATPSASQLAFTPPPGVQVVEKGFGRPIPAARARELARSWGGLLEPRSLPPGYRFQSYHVHSYQGQEAVVTVFGGPDGSSPVSLFQGPVVGMDGFAGRMRRSLQVLTARKSSADLAVVGDLPRDQLQRMLDSVQQAP